MRPFVCSLTQALMAATASCVERSAETTSAPMAALIALSQLSSTTSASQVSIHAELAMESSVLPAVSVNCCINPAQSASSSAAEQPSSALNSADVSPAAPSATMASAKYAESGEMAGFSASSFAASAASAAPKSATAAAFSVLPCTAAGSRFAVRFWVMGLECPCEPGFGTPCVPGTSAAQPQKSSAPARHNARQLRRFRMICFMCCLLLCFPCLTHKRRGGGKGSCHVSNK